MAVVSRRTLTLFAKTMSQRFVLREIDDAFKAEGLEPSGAPEESSGQRRGLFESYVNGVNQRDPAVVNQFTEALSWFLRRIDGTHKEDIISSLRRDGFDTSDGRIVSAAPHGFTLTTIQDFEAIAERAALLRREASTHPNDAIGHARELVESTCKTILEDHGARVPDGMKDLVEATLSTLRLVPSDAHEAKKGADAIKATLLALDIVLRGVSDLRRLYSGHGRSIRKNGLGARHAALAVGAALTIVEFLIATHAETE
jgi:hypothetical protein